MTHVLVFLSGLAGLVYEVLWMKQLGLLFGSTSHAAAATLAAFFAGLAAGSWFWGRRVAGAVNALRVYAWLEAGIALTALLYFVVLRLFHAIYPWLYPSIAATPWLLPIKFALALLLVFPPAFCMGGTIPVVGQYLVRSPSSFGATAAWLYGVNTLGAALGALLAGFWLPLWLGFTATCVGAMTVSCLVAVTAFVLSRRSGVGFQVSVRPRERSSGFPSMRVQPVVSTGWDSATCGTSGCTRKEVAFKQGVSCQVPATEVPVVRDHDGPPGSDPASAFAELRRDKTTGRRPVRTRSRPSPTCRSQVGTLGGLQEQGVGLKGSGDDRGLQPETRSPIPVGGRWSIASVCFLSGFGVLALEVLWTRLFAQVLENSVYTFAAILVIVLICLAAGAFLSSRLARRAASPCAWLALLLVLGGLAIAVTPFVFMWLTDGMQIVASRGSWPGYVRLIFRTGFLAIGLPALLLGTVFPFLMKVEERQGMAAGASLGRLAAINTAGAILGSLAAGFVFLEVLGLWRTMQLLSALYLVAGLVLSFSGTRPAAGRSPVATVGIVILRATPALALLLLAGPLDPGRLPVASADPLREREETLETWEGSDCTVAATLGRNGVAIRINSHYSLGSTGAMAIEKLQADIPLMAYPGTRSLFFLGLGTGITAGSALDPQFSNVTRVVACELVPEVVIAAKKYIANFQGEDYTGGLFSDPRVTVRVEDGRHYLMAARERFDMVNADLFVPYRSGAGSLYSLEHFRSVKDRLEPGGLFVQWLPLYQVTQYEFGVIARTMLEVFDQVSMWRNNFQPGDEVVALVGHKGGVALPASGEDSHAARLAALEGKDAGDLARLNLPFNRSTILFFYCGNLTAVRNFFADYPVNTDDKPVIEYMAPRTYRDAGDTAVPWFVGPRLARWVDAIQERCPPERDPLLANRTPAERRLPVAGAAYHWARLWEVMDDEAECRRAWRRFVREFTRTDEG